MFWLNQTFSFKREALWPHAWSVRSTPEPAVRVRALAGDHVLCSWQDTLHPGTVKLLGQPNKIAGE